MGSYVIPESFQDKKDLIWINFIAYDLEQQKAYARGKNPVFKGNGRLGSWKLLAPREISENVSHDWGTYESLASRVAQKVGDIKTLVIEGKTVINALGTGWNESKKQIADDHFSATQIALSTASAATGGVVPKFKMDAATAYQNSKNLQYSMQFQLALMPGDKGSKQTLFDPIRELQILTCAEAVDDLININFPAVFKIFSEPSEIISIEHAVITSIQPTWMAPYVEDYPSVCHLDITFMDIEPLYRKSFGDDRRARILTSED